MEQTLGHLVGAASHLLASIAPLGTTAVGALGLLAQALQAIPTGILTGLEGSALAAYAAFRTYRGVTAIVAGVTAAVGKMAAANDLAALQITSSAATIQAAAATEASLVATAKSEEATAAADAAASMVASGAEVDSLFANQASSAAGTAASMAESFAGINSLFATEAETATQATAVVAAELRVQAEAAAANAAAMADAAVLANASLAGAGGAAGAGAAGALGAGAKFAKLLGPLAAVGVGVGLLTTLFAKNNDQAQANQKIMDSYAASLQTSSDALASVNINASIKNLADAHSADAIKALGSANDGLGLSLGKLAFSINGPKAGFDSLITKLQGVAAANKDVALQGSKFSPGTKGYNAQGVAANTLIGTLRKLRGGLTGAEKAQQQYADAQRAALVFAAGGADALTRTSKTLGIQRDNYLSALDAVTKNTAQTDKQTAAFQLEGDAASLLDQVLQKLAGRGLSQAEANTALRQANLQVLDSFKKTGVAIRGGSAAAVAHQSALQGEARAAIAAAQNVAKLTHSSGEEVVALAKAKAGIEAQLAARHKLTPAVQAYINKLYDLNSISAGLKPTNLKVSSAAGLAKIAELQASIRSIKQGKVPGLTANSTAGRTTIRLLQREIDALRQQHPVALAVNPASAQQRARALQTEINAIRQGHDPKVNVNTFDGERHLADLQNRLNYLRDKTVTVTVNTQSIGHLAQAAGGTIYGGTPGKDSVPAMLMPGEEVIRASQASKHRGLLKAINAGVQGFAGGGTVGYNAGLITQALRALGIGRAGIAGVLGNAQIESGLRSTAYNAREGAVNFFQYEGGRRSSLQSTASRLGVSEFSAKAGVAELVKELSGPFRSVLNGLRRARSPTGAAALFDSRFETVRAAREAAARRFYAHIPTAAAGTGSGGGKAAAAAAAPKIPYVFQGKQFSTARSAENAALAQSRSQLKLDVKIDRKDIVAFNKALAGTVTQSRAAFATLLADARKAGISGHAARVVTAENKRLDIAISDRNGLNRRLAAMDAQLKVEVGKYTAEMATVKAAVTSSFDVTSAGTGFDGQQPITGGNIVAEQRQAAIRAKLFVSDVIKLGKLIPGPYVRQLAEKGPTALPEAQALLGSSRTAAAVRARPGQPGGLGCPSGPVRGAAGIQRHDP